MTPQPESPCPTCEEYDCRACPHTQRVRSREGPIIKGGGVSKPDHWDNDRWAEYKMTAEYAHEVRHVSDDEPDDYDEFGGPEDYYDDVEEE